MTDQQTPRPPVFSPLEELVAQVILKTVEDNVEEGWNEWYEALHCARAAIKELRRMGFLAEDQG